MSNKIYLHQEAPVAFSTAMGGIDFAPTGLPPGSGHKSNELNLGTAARSRLFNWRAFTKLDGTPSGVVGSVDVYLITSNGVRTDGNIGSGEMPVSANKFYNFKFVGSLNVDDEGASPVLINSGYVDIPSQYVSFAFLNDTDIPISSTDSDSGLTIIPVPDTVQ